MITKDELDAVYERVFPIAANIIERGASQAPVIARLERHDGKLEFGDVMLLPMDTPQHKELVGKLLRMMRAECGPDSGVMFVNEVWHKAVNVNAGEKVDHNTPVSEQPGAHEGVMFSFFGTAFDYQAICPISRSPNRLDRAELEVIVGSHGRMSHHNRDEQP